MRKIIATIFITLLCVGMLTACNKTDDGPVVLDFVNYTDDDLSEYAGKEVVLYGYFTLNATVDNKAYISSLPYTAILNDQSNYEEITYEPISMQKTGAIPVFFNTTPEYTTTPVKITGTLKKVDTYDDVAYVSYVYAITDAEYSFVESYSLGSGFKEFVTFTKAGYPDVIYQNLLKLEMFACGIEDKFPEEQNYDDIKADLKDTKSTALKDEYLKHLEKTHELYEKYSKEKEIDKDVLLEETSKLVADYIGTIDKFAAFRVIKDNGDGFDKLEAIFTAVKDESTTSESTTEESIAVGAENTTKK